MDADGGGWTIIYAATGASGEQTLISNSAVNNNPLSFQHYNLPNGIKILIDATATETLFKKNNGQWIKTNRNLDYAQINVPNTHKDNGCTVTARNGAVDSSAIMGWSNYNK
jgi:hypothetical protein